MVAQAGDSAARRYARAHEASVKAAEAASRAQAKANEMRARRAKAESAVADMLAEVFLEAFPDLPRDPDDLEAFLRELREGRDMLIASRDADGQERPEADDVGDGDPDDDGITEAFPQL